MFIALFSLSTNKDYQAAKLPLLKTIDSLVHFFSSSTVVLILLDPDPSSKIFTEISVFVRVQAETYARKRHFSEQ